MKVGEFFIPLVGGVPAGWGGLPLRAKPEELERRRHGFS